MMNKGDSIVRSKILSYFEKNCVGRDSAIKKEDLRKAITHCYGVILSERDLREEISRIPEIGSHNSVGYFYINGKADLDLFLSDVRSRTKSLNERASRAEENYYSRKGNQGEMF